MINKASLIFFLGISFGHVIGQVETPPTLALGVAGVVGEKGSIDIEVLSQIIFEKQTELKKEFIKKTFFNDLEDHSYVIWEYVYSSTNVLLESESKEAIKKNLLKNASNLALVYGFAELYLQLSTRMCNDDLDNFLQAFDSTHYKNDFSCPVKNADTVKVGLIKLKEYSYVLQKEKIKFSAVLIDLIFEVLLENKNVTETLGFLNGTFPLGRDYYKDHSAYHRIMKYGHPELREAAQEMKNRLTTELSVLLDNFILIKKLNQSDMSLEELIANYREIVFPNRDSLSTEDFKLSKTKIFDSLVDQTSSIYDELRAVNGTVLFSDPAGRNEMTRVAVTEVDKELSETLTENLAAFSRFVNKNTDFQQYDLYYLENSIKPLLVRLVAEKGFNPKYLTIADQFDKLITLDLLEKLKLKLDNANFKDLPKAKISNFSGLLEFITRLDELDKVGTYQYVLKIIQSVDDIFDNKTFARYVKTLVDNLDTYTIINESENKIEIAVEDIITRIYEKYSGRQSGIFSLYFSIGVNQSISSNFSYQTLLPDSSGFETTSLKSLAFVSEKIGLKIKIIDVKWRRSFGVGETYESKLFRRPHEVKKFRSSDPLISDIYFVAYGSGILYNIANLATSEEFTDPIAGLGVGVAFFNALDLNIGYNWPLQSQNDFFDSFESQNIWTVSFEVKIVEYLAAVSKKKRLRKADEI